MLKLCTPPQFHIALHRWMLNMPFSFVGCLHKMSKLLPGQVGPNIEMAAGEVRNGLFITCINVLYQCGKHTIYIP